MPYNPLEYLKSGKVDFVYTTTPYDYKHLIERVRETENRIEIINGFLPKLRGELPHFCFEIIYDIPEFEEDAYKLFRLDYMTPEILNNALRNSPFGLKILYENFDTFLSITEKTKFFNFFDVVACYAFDSNNKDLLQRLSRNKDLHTRYLFMRYLVKNHPDKINEIYGDITMYMTSVTYEKGEQLTFLPKIMDEADLSKLAVQLLINNREADYNKIKELILKEYKLNTLASELLRPAYIVDPDTHRLLDDPNSTIKQAAFDKDPNTLFETSSNYRFPLYLEQQEKIRKDLIDNFYSKIKYFMECDRKGTPQENELYRIYRHGLGESLENWTEKYMDLSTSKEFGFVEQGTTCSCYRIGDYVIKLIKGKWSYEDEICPDIYLVAKAYERIYVRDENGVVDSGLEVQKFLTRSAKDIDPKYLRYFDLALDELGYMRTDTLVNGSRGDNAMLLDTYKDADCPNPEKVPGWFKKYPLVLIDRDRIYPKDTLFIKQLREGGS